MHDVFTIAGQTFRGTVKGQLSLLFLVGIVVLGVVLVQSGPDDPRAVAAKCRTVGLQITLWTSLLLVVIAGSAELPREVHSGTIYFLLTKPVVRRDIVFGKLAGLIAVAYSYVLLQTIVSIVVIWIRGVDPNWAFFLETLLITGRVTILAASVVMFSTALGEFPTIFFCAVYLMMGILMSLLDTLITCGPFGWPI
ncbi:unnamed protein product, partial [marine sediment metagenome]